MLCLYALPSLATSLMPNNHSSRDKTQHLIENHIKVITVIMPSTYLTSPTILLFYEDFLHDNRTNFPCESPYTLIIF